MSSEVADVPEVYLPVPQHRIRHITSLQVRNLTPFPARDALAQTLTQPGPSSSPLNTQPADDLELIVASRRRRRISSSSSIVTMMTIDGDEDGPSGTLTRRQTRSGSRSFQSSRSTISASGTSTIRPRARTSSKASSVHIPNGQASKDTSDPPFTSDQDNFFISGQFFTYSQRSLEKIVSSRLVETFITLTQHPSTTAPAPLQPSSPSSSPSANSHIVRKGKEVSVKRAISASVGSHRRGVSNSSTNSTLSSTSSQLTRSHSSIPSSPVASRARINGSLRNSSTKAANFPSPPPTPPPGSSRSKPLPSSRPQSENKRPRENNEPESPSLIATPFYISPIHHPSTNPSFLQLDSEREFAPWADMSGSCVKIAIWGRNTGESSLANPEIKKNAKGKAKEADGEPGKNETPWKILEEWLVDLNDLEPLSSDVAMHQLPSNTLLLTISSGQVFHVPPLSGVKSLSPPSRVPTPLGHEYSSDGEVDDRRRWRQLETGTKETHKQEERTGRRSPREPRMRKSGTWQDLVKLVNLHTCIVDTREVLEEVVSNCDALLETDGYQTSLRDCSAREEWISTIQAEREQVVESCTKVEARIEVRKRDLQLRRSTLAEARKFQEEDVSKLGAQFQEIVFERQRHLKLVSSLHPVRAELIQTVSYIFPIEPLSAPDLLFTILGSPLPIPVSASDPAPPLFLSSYPDITEDTTATALGHVAQVVQLVSAYLGKCLVYPVTCCGSRSIIKDPISAMMGPRMFPLYSKGVETYRFEYGVFLLNKNIEMLMMDRNLRAMDMRHTLPNLKNLLLTLTTGEEKQTPRLGSSIGTGLPSGIRSSNRAISPLALDAQLESISTESSSDISPRKPTPFLSPLAAILRARYPSSAGRPTIKIVHENPRAEAVAEGGDEVDLEDAREASVEGVPSDLVSSSLDDSEAKVTIKPSGLSPTPITNGNAMPFEKLTNNEGPLTPPPPSPLPSFT